MKKPTNELLHNRIPQIQVIITIIIFLSFNYNALAQWKIAGLQGDYIFNVTRIDSSLLVGEWDNIWISNDSGINDWKSLTGNVMQPQRIQKYKEKILVTANSGLYESKPPYNYWQMINNGVLPGNCLLTLDTLWLAGITGDGVYRSTDEGRNWTRNIVYGDSLQAVTSLLQVDSRILAVTAKGLQVSEDYGLTWHNINPDIWGGWTYSNALLSIGDTIYAGGVGGLLKSVDRGLTWLSLGLTYVGNIIEHNGRIFVIASQSVYYTDDGGMNWTRVYDDGYEIGWGFQPMCLDVFKDKMFLATARGLYYMNLIEFDSPRLYLYGGDRIDLGEIEIGTIKDTSITFQNRGYKDLEITEIISTSNFIEVSPQNITIRPGDVKNIYIKVHPKAAGKLEIILIIKSNDLGSVKKIPLEINVTPIEYRLSENYPNPFNASTTIEYQISAIENVNISIYNMIGERIKILVDEIKDPGKHKIIFNANNLSSGVYLYRLKTNNFESARKLILMK